MNALERLKYGGLLREGQWFGGLSPRLQDAILESSSVRWYGRGSIIQLQDSTPEALFAVLEGQVAVQRWATPDQQVLIDLASPGSWFGELALLLHADAGDVKTGLEAVARTDAGVLALGLAAYEALIEDGPDHYRQFARLALERYDMCLRSETESRVLAADELLMAKLADLADLRHQERSCARAIVLGLTQSDVAALTGLSRQTVNAELHRLEERGLIEIAFRQIRIADVERLRARLATVRPVRAVTAPADPRSALADRRPGRHPAARRAASRSSAP